MNLISLIFIINKHVLIINQKLKHNLKNHRVQNKSTVIFKYLIVLCF